MKKPQNTVVATLPPAIATGVCDACVGIESTYATVGRLVEAANGTIKIFAPYVDPTFTGILAAVKRPVRILTTPSPGRPPRPNPVLERCATLADLSVRYLDERRDRALIFQMHAKMVLVEDAAYVGSSNMTDTSVHYNFELGLVERDPAVLAKLERLFDYMWNIGVRAGEL